jgi:hypothetical protein
MKSYRKKIPYLKRIHPKNEEFNLIKISAMKKFFLLFCLSGMISCGIVHDENIKDEEIVNEEYSTNTLKSFINLHTITRENTISPDYVSHLDTANNYSVGYNFEIKQLKTKEASKVKVTASYYFPEPGTVSIVCSVNAGDSVVFWKAVPVDQNKALRKWATEEVTFDLLKTYNGDERISAYMWATNKDEVFVGELKVIPIK